MHCCPDLIAVVKLRCAIRSGRSGGNFRATPSALALSCALLIHCFEPGTGAAPEWSIAALARTGVSGVVTGLAGSALTLRNNDGAELIVSANGAFSFPEIPETGAAYNVTIAAQPTDLRCFVENGSGTYNGVATNIVVTCPLALIGGVTWMRCTYGQTWNAATGDCTGAGDAANFFGAVGDLVFCRRVDGLPDGGQIDGGQTNDCNSGVPGGALNAGQNAHISTLYLACDSLNASAVYGLNNWRVASKAEFAAIESCSLGLTAPDVNGDYSCTPGSLAPTVVANYFPQTVEAIYSTSTADPCCDDSFWLNRYSDGLVTRSSGTKQLPSYARCVSP